MSDHTVSKILTYIKERVAMVNLITGPRGSGKTQQMIDLANEKVMSYSSKEVIKILIQ